MNAPSYLSPAKATYRHSCLCMSTASGTEELVVARTARGLPGKPNRWVLPGKSGSHANFLLLPARSFQARASRTHSNTPSSPKTTKP